MSTVVKDLGAVSAYAYAVEKGYTGTEAEFAELMADYAEVGQRAEDAADSALESKTAAQTAATTATNKATEATTAATTATNKAAEAQADADAAALDASQALSAASTATTKATEATTAAATATSAKTDAVAANTAAQSAKTAAQTAQTGAETAAASVSASAAQIATNAEDISQLKSDLTQNDSRIKKIGEVDTISGSGYVSIYYPVKANQPYFISLKTGRLRLSTRNTPNGDVVEWLIGNSSASSSFYAQSYLIVTPTVDANYLRIASDSDTFEFTITYASSSIFNLNKEVDASYNFMNATSYRNYAFTIKAGKTYIILFKSGRGRLYTYSNGTIAENIIETVTTAPFEIVFTATQDADYIRISADDPMTLTIVEADSLNGRLLLQDYYSRHFLAQDIYSPYPQLPADSSSDSDFNAETMKTADVYTYLDNLVTKYPQVLTKTTMGKDATNTFDINRYVFADSTKSSFLATVLIWANEHGPSSDPREPAVVACRFLSDLCKAHAKTNPYLNYLKKNFKFVVIPVLNPYGFDNNSRNNGNNVNINRNYPTPGWSVVEDTDKGSSAGSEVETQYVVSTIDTFTPDVAMDIHCLGYVNAANDKKCHWEGVVKNRQMLNVIVDEMMRDYGLTCTSYGVGDYNLSSTGDAYLAYKGIDGLLLEFNGREGSTSDNTLHTSTILEADYTFMLRILNMLLTCYDAKLEWT